VVSTQSTTRYDDDLFFFFFFFFGQNARTGTYGGMNLHMERAQSAHTQTRIKVTEYYSGVDQASLGQTTSGLEQQPSMSTQD
jgi:hypothetical protein